MALAAWVQSRKRYPDDVRQQGIEGQVAGRVTFGRDSQVLEASIARSSGPDPLARVASSMFQGGRRYPADMAQARATVTTAIRYRLEG